MLAHISARGESAPPPPALAPDIRAHKSFHSEFLPNDRDVLVYLPPCYAREAERRYTEVNGGRHDERPPGQNESSPSSATSSRRTEQSEAPAVHQPR